MQSIPTAHEAERAVLGALLLDADAAGVVFDALGSDPEVFYEDAGRAVYEAALRLRRAGHGVDVATIVGDLTRTGDLDRAGGAAAVSDLASAATTGHYVADYCTQVLDAATRRALILRCRRLAEEAARGPRDARALLADAERDLAELATRHAVGDAVAVGVDLDGLVQRFDALRVGGGIVGLRSGFDDLDRITGGLQPGTMTILAARPSVGKSALALNIAANVAQGGAPGLFHSLEMGADELRERLVLSLAGIRKSDLRNLSFQAMSAKLSPALDQMEGMPLHIDDRPGISTLDLRASVRRAVRKHGVQLVVMDYLQLLRPESRRDMRSTEVAELSAACKGVAKEMRVAVLVLSQLNRLGDSDEPRLSHLRESGAIEQDADVVVLLSKRNAEGTVVNANVAKNRTGATGTCSLHFDKMTQTFRPYSAQTPEAASVASGGGYFDDGEGW